MVVKVFLFKFRQPISGSLISHQLYPDFRFSNCLSPDHSFTNALAHLPYGRINGSQSYGDQHIMISKQAILAGHICLDIAPDFSSLEEGQFQRLFQPGRLLQTNTINLSTGGSVPNTGLSMHRLGVPVRLIGKIGTDLFGQAVQDILRHESPHLAEDLVIDLSLPTSATIIINSSGFDRAFLHNPGANKAFYASDLRREILQGADLFHFGYPPLMRSIYRGDGAELVSIFQRARRAGLTTSLDFTLPDLSSPAGEADWPTILANALPFVDLFVPSIEELAFLLDRDAFDRMCADKQHLFVEKVDPGLLDALSEIVLSYGVKALLVKLGHRGVYLRTASQLNWEKAGRGLEGLDDSWHERKIWAPAYQAAVRGTCGAGDAAIAGFLASILKGTNPETALKMAAAAGAISVESTIVHSGLKTWDEVWRRIQQGWETLTLDLSAQGWRKDQDLDLWTM